MHHHFGPQFGRQLDPAGPGEWTVPVPPDAKEATLTATYSLPVRDGAVPVGLLWPAAAARVESTVRVWNCGGERSVGVDPGPWRLLPPEPDPGRDVLPVRTLAGSGSDLPLTLTVAPPVVATGAVGQVGRGLVQVWLGDDGTAAARARFVLSRWLGDGVDVALPPPLPGTTVEVLVDGKRVEPAPGPNGWRVPLPEPRSGRAAVLDIRYRFPFGSWRPLPIPELVGAAVGPVRVQVTAPPGSVPLLAGGRPEQRWVARGFVFAPLAPAADELRRGSPAGPSRPAGVPRRTPPRPGRTARCGRRPCRWRRSWPRARRWCWCSACSRLASPARPPGQL